jgi:outer membrane lipoprotein carrier protein
MRDSLLLAVAAVLLAAVSSPVPLPAAGQSERSPEALARALEERYAGIRDFSADFTQVYRSILRAESRQRGTVAIKKPGRVRWVYTEPDRQEVVSDGVRTYVSSPEDNVVYVQDVPTGDEASTADLFLSGRGDISSDFTPKIVESPVTGTIGLELVPVEREASYERLVLAIDAKTLQILGLTTFDAQGGQSAIQFHNLRENTGLDDAYFNFQIPRGADVQFN